MLNSSHIENKYIINKTVSITFFIEKHGHGVGNVNIKP